MIRWFAVLFALSLWAEPDPFVLVADWPKLPPEINLGPASGVAADARGRVYIGHRGEHPLLLIAPDGTLVRAFGDAEIPPSVAYEMSRRWVHGVRVDHRDHLWVTDVGRHVVLEFDPDGRLLRTFGTPGVPGEDASHFNQPTDVAVTGKGEVYVSDGYINSRVVQFGSDGRLIRTWGRRGTGPGEFNTPHSIRLDSRGRVYVSDRANSRIQIFEPDGRFIGQWDGPGPRGRRFARLHLLRPGRVPVWLDRPRQQDHQAGSRRQAAADLG